MGAVDDLRKAIFDARGMRPILVNKDGEVIRELYKDTAGSPILPRVGEHVCLENSSEFYGRSPSGEFVVFKVRWDFELNEIQVFVTPIPISSDEMKG